MDESADIFRSMAEDELDGVDDLALVGTGRIDDRRETFVKRTINLKLKKNIFALLNYILKCLRNGPKT